jgi:sugar lactone lactonase YvrE
MNVDLNGNIYILDGGNNQVTKWTPGALNGTIVAGGNGEGSNANQLYYPYGMFIGLNTSIIWIADTGNNRIVRWESSSTGIIVCGSYGTEANQFYFPFGLFVDTSASNTFYVADTYNHRIQMWLPGATNGATVAGQTGVCGTGLNQLCYPQSVTKDTYGNIYIIDRSNNRIMQWMIGSTSGVIIGGSSTYGTLPNQLYFPYNIKLDPSGAGIVADTYNNRIQKFSVSCSKFQIYFYPLFVV